MLTTLNALLEGRWLVDYHKIPQEHVNHGFKVFVLINDKTPATTADIIML